MAVPATVAVYGGSGFFGRLVVDDLLASTEAQIAIAGRHAAKERYVSPRLMFVRSDLCDLASARATLAGASVVVHCAGPFQLQASTLIQAAIDSGAHYLDLAEDAGFVQQTRAFDAVARLRAVTGFPRLERWAEPLRKCLKMLGRFGTNAGGVLVEVAGIRKVATMTQQIARVAERNGERIPALLATIVTGALLIGWLPERIAALFPLGTFLSGAVANALYTVAGIILTVDTPSLGKLLRIWAWTIWVTGFALTTCTLYGNVLGITTATTILMGLLCPWVALFGWSVARDSRSIATLKRE